MMDVKITGNRSAKISSQAFLFWRLAQAVVWLIGLVILFCLLFFPRVGVMLFWNILIPVAPALFVVAAGVWRNVCPLATTNLLPRHFGLSKRKKLSITQAGKLNLISVLALYAIVPLRHAVFNSSGVATGIMIIVLAFAGIITGFFYEWKSAWCSGLCPVHPVEKLYGGKPFITVPNMHCSACENCVVPCPDSTPNIHPKATVKTIYHKLSAVLIIGGLPGFIWGWFHVPDNAIINFVTLVNAYRVPLAGFLVSVIIYQLLSVLLAPKNERVLTNIFAALGVSCYYWYRIPALFGFGRYKDDGLLLDLRNTLHQWNILVITIAATIFFFYWMVWRKANRKNWASRPPYAMKRIVGAGSRD